MHPRACPACGADAPAGALECAWCGSALVPLALSPEQREETLRCIHDLNELMLIKRKKLLRQADLAAAAVGLTGILLIRLGTALFDFNSGFTAQLVFLAVTLLAWRFLRRRRMVNGLIACFQSEIDPAAAQFAAGLALPRWQFDQLAARELKPNDPLRRFMFARSSR